MRRVDLFQLIGQQNGSASYLEIGCQADNTFRQVNFRHKVGVDPNRGGTHRMTSDAFFAQNIEAFDLVFMDGPHLFEQVLWGSV